MLNKHKIFSSAIIIAVFLLGWLYIISPEIQSQKIENNSKEIKTLKLGLDLSGGSQLLYNADISKLEKENVEDIMEVLKETLEKRLNTFGTSEVSITIEEASIFSKDNQNFRRLIVEIPGISNTEEAKKIIGRIPLLEFKLKTDSGEYQDIGLGGKDLKNSNLTTNQVGQPAVLIEFNKEGTEIFSKLTTENIGKQMGIFVDGIPISEPFLRAKIHNGISIIEGNFSLEEASELTKNLKLGTLPVHIYLESSSTISPSLGHKTLILGIRSALVGFLFIILFLIIVYRISGLLASLALISYVILTLSLFKFFGFVFTSAGIAGFIISIGLAVDANILIFERIKEELKGGKEIRDSIIIGFKRAWPSIRDGNLSSIITAIILFYMTTSLVQGFSLTFGFGIVISMFTAITITRTFLLSIPTKSNKNKYKKFLIGNFERTSIIK